MEEVIMATRRSVYFSDEVDSKLRKMAREDRRSLSNLIGKLVIDEDTRRIELTLLPGEQGTDRPILATVEKVGRHA
jgi:predicted CopG family antitoxin